MLSVSSFGRAGPPCRFDAAGINPSTRAEDNCTRQRTVQRQQVHASCGLSLKSAKRRNATTKVAEAVSLPYFMTAPPPDF